MSRLRTLLATAALPLVLVAGGLAPAHAGAGVPATDGAHAAAAPRVPKLTKIRSAHHPGFDRVVFRFRGQVPEVLEVGWARKVTMGGSGFRLPLQGAAFIEVTFVGHTHVERDGTFKRTFKRPVRSLALPNLNHLIVPAHFESVVTAGLGTMKRTRLLRWFTLEDPSRLVIDVGTRFPRAKAKVYFIDKQAAEDGTEPLVRPVRRTVPTPAVAAGSLHRLYAGPTRPERRDDLRLVTSIVRPKSGPDRTGFRDLSIRRGVARVTITGRCSSGGSTITVADQLMPTLKHWPTVDFVKIFDRDGETGRPKGRSDSIPACLEP